MIGTNTPSNGIPSANPTCAFCEDQLAPNSSAIALFYSKKGSSTSTTYVACSECVVSLNQALENRVGCGGIDLDTAVEEEDITEARA